MEYELLDTGIFDEDRYFDVIVEYAKAAHDDILMLVTAHNRGPDAATLHLLPTLWFRNTWSWGDEVRQADADGRRRGARVSPPRAPPTPSSAMAAARRRLGASCCSARTRPTTQRLFGAPNASPYVKDGINDFVVRRRRRRGQPRADRHQGRGPSRARDRGRATAPRSACG